MVEWFERAGLPESSQVIREALAVFGEHYSRSQEERQAFLDRFKDTDEDDWDPAWDPFDKLSDRFLPTSEDQQAFDEAADKWLRNVCGIRNLHDHWK